MDEFKKLKTTISGFPRIGKKRELKFAIEDYFKGKIDETELERISSSLRKEHWSMQTQAGLSEITVNDFSYYDSMLDTAFLFGAIPREYLHENLGTTLQRYFAVARGFQNQEMDLRAFEMKKWFTTNYHYVVPQISKDQDWKLNPEKVMLELREAKETGKKFRVSFIGPYTFLRFSRFIDQGKNIRDYYPSFSLLYAELIETLANENVEKIQLEEPALVLDASAEDVKDFVEIYKNLFSKPSKLKVHLQTYFGDVRDFYEAIMELPFASVGIDFVEGTESLNLLEKKGFPENKELYAGVINGKNVWANDYAKTLQLIERIKKVVNPQRLVLSTAASLLHSPYSLRYETKMPDEIKEQLSFAIEKMQELQELAILALDDNYAQNPLFIKNQEMHKRKQNSLKWRNVDVQKRVETLQEKDFHRPSDYKRRDTLQKSLLNLPKYPTTTIGSFPQTQEVREMRKRYRKGEINEADYKRFIQEEIKKVIRLQEEIGLDVLVHGEFERNDMVEYFAENLEGFVTTQNGWVQSYGTRGVKPPIIFGDVHRSAPFTVEWITYAQSLTSKPVKGMLTGPITIINWSFPREDYPLEKTTYQIALALRDEIYDLEQSGIHFNQVDEAALREKLPLRKQDREEYLRIAINGFRLTTSGVEDKTQIHTHMCYSEFGDIMGEIDQMDADVITIESAKSNLQILEPIQKINYSRQIGPGVYDIHSPRIPNTSEIVDHVLQMTHYLPDENIWINPDCGLKTRGYSETVASLQHMVEAAKKMREAKQ